MSTGQGLSMPLDNRIGVGVWLRRISNICKLRIGVTIAFTALAGLAVTPGAALATWQVVVLGMAVLISSAAAGGFNQYYEREFDARMQRTRNRPFVTGEIAAGPGWLMALYGMVAVSVVAAGLATNWLAAFFVFLGAFFYGVVYTVWLKRRSWTNIVIGGLAGSFAVLAGPGWLMALYGMVAVSVVAAGLATNWLAAFFVFLGAFFYGVVYTVWLKRRSWTNIVIGGLAGSFAVLAGAAAVDPGMGTVPLLLALVLFLWTPSHFWSLAIAMHKDYASAGVPMLPVVIGDRAAAKIVLANTLLLVAASLLPVLYGLGAIYFVGAALGGAYFLYTNIGMLRDPNPRTAMVSFHASLMQLSLLLTAAIIDVQWYA